MFERILKNVKLIAAAERLRPGEAVRLAGVWGSSSALAAAALGRLAGAPVLFVTRHLDEADEVADDVEVLSGLKAQVFPAWEVDLQVGSGGEHLSDEVTGERLRMCNLLSEPADRRDEPADFIVAPIMALLQPVPTPEALAESRLSLAAGGEMDPADLGTWLVDAGFERVEQVDRQGEFSRRGGIVDIFPAGVATPVRIEFFGDQIDSIRRFDLDTLRSGDELPACDIASLSAGAGGDPNATTDLLSYLPDETVVCLVEPGEVRDLAGELHRRIVETVGEGAMAIRGVEDLFASIARCCRAEMFTFMPRRRDSVVALDIRSLERVAINTHEALMELEELSATAEVRVYCENPAEQGRFMQLLTRSHPRLAERVQTAIGHVHSGFHWRDEALVAVGHHEIFQRYTKLRRIRRVRTGRPIDSLLDLSEGDYVVHVAHGIARFEGLRKLTEQDREEEYLTLRFRDNAVLHVPASQINLVQKYIGARGKRPSLSKLGGTGWLRQKQRASEAVKDMAAEMLRVQAMRQSQEGFEYPETTDLQTQFVEEFPYSETEDQIVAMEQIDRDMSVARPMDRLLCGDVGYGKTELAMRAAFKVVEAGRQAAVLVPTTVLADQHFRSFNERFADYPVRVDVISRFRTPKEQTELLKRLTLGEIDILIGTHRILSKDVRFADLGLVVIDEEQRFGVEHKDQLKQMRAMVDVLTMTATPIPRTMHMALLGLRDISSLTTPPLDRRAIHTEVVHYDESLIRSTILRELNRQGQVFFVHNRVMDIDPLAEHVRTVAPEAKVAVAHGQMTEGKLEETMLRFVRGEIDVLVCTTIIESGLDIPSANTMLVHDADRFGLAQLHQLRGRIGRYKHRAFCYLLLPQTRPVRSVAAKRLKTIEEFSDLGAGFQIAMRDLELRGAGNILGREQSGHIAAVGYELYCQLLEDAVRELQGKPAASRRHVHVELGIDAYIPRSYISSERQRMEIYRRLAGCSAPGEIKQLAADLDDAYGATPEPMQMLLDVVEIRVLAAPLGVESIIRMDPDLVFTVRDHALAEEIFTDAAGSVRLPDAKTVHWRMPPVYRRMPTFINVLLNRLRRAGEDL